MPCRICIELETSLASARKADYPAVLGLTEAGTRNRAQQKAERIQRIETLLKKHQAQCAEALRGAVSNCATAH